MISISAILKYTYNKSYLLPHLKGVHEMNCNYKHSLYYNSKECVERAAVYTILTSISNNSVTAWPFIYGILSDIGISNTFLTNHNYILRLASTITISYVKYNYNWFYNIRNSLFRYLSLSL